MEIDMGKLPALAHACALALTVAACERPAAEPARARPAAITPQTPQLWLAEALDAEGKVVDTVQVCADTVLRQGFTRANAEINGQQCNPLRDAVDRPGLYAVRCEIAGRRFGVTVNQTGDLERDFQVRFALTTLDGTNTSATQVRRYRKIGTCPDGWVTGDQSKPGGPRGSNAIGHWSETVR
jgi:hypothetical protein